MALDQSALIDLLEVLKNTDVDERVRSATEHLYQALIDAELTAAIGAAPHQRTDTRTTQRNGSRPRTLTTTAGDLELRIPKLRAGSFFPSLLERRRRIDQALFAVVMEAYLHGVSTRKVDDLVKALGADTGISKSEVSRICADLDEEVAAFRDRPLTDTAFPYVFLDATYCKARVNRRVLSQAVVIATGVAADGHREVLGFAVGDSEDGAFWTAFLRSLKARGLSGTQLVISDAHAARLSALFGRDEHVQVEATWRIYQRMITAYRDTDRVAGLRTMRTLIDALSKGVPTQLTELITLGRTLKRRAADVLAHFPRPGTSNGPTEAINGRLEHLRGSALGFRNLTNYIARSLLETGGFRPRLHRQL